MSDWGEGSSGYQAEVFLEKRRAEPVERKRNIHMHLSPPVSLNVRMHERRTEMDIIAAILGVALQDHSKTHIMLRASLSYSQLQVYLKYLLRAELLRKNGSEGRTSYITTPKGKEFITEYKALRKLMEIDS